MHRAPAHTPGALGAVVLELQRRVAIVVHERGVPVNVPCAPDGERADDLAEVSPTRCQRVRRPGRVLRVELARDDGVRLEHLQSFGEHVGRDALERREQILKPARTGQQIADDEQRPALPEDLERLGDRTRLTVALGPARL